MTESPFNWCGMSSPYLYPKQLGGRPLFSLLKSTKVLVWARELWHRVWSKSFAPEELRLVKVTVGWNIEIKRTLETKAQVTVTCETYTCNNLRKTDAKKQEPYWNPKTLRFRGFCRDEAARFSNGLEQTTKAGENCDQIDSRLKTSTQTCQTKNYKYFAIQVLTPIQRVC